MTRQWRQAPDERAGNTSITAGPRAQSHGRENADLSTIKLADSHGVCRHAVEQGLDLHVVLPQQPTDEGN
ncbi:hypothetical protein GCM10010182_56810 [Actinomadura cremea]|nr:hypothetical protein GCM10010182_56810 [Actinomadura cremea]